LTPAANESILRTPKFELESAAAARKCCWVILLWKSDGITRRRRQGLPCRGSRKKGGRREKPSSSDWSDGAETVPELKLFSRKENAEDNGSRTASGDIAPLCGAVIRSVEEAAEAKVDQPVMVNLGPMLRLLAMLRRQGVQVSEPSIFLSKIAPTVRSS
jgi:hypothetical protein